MQGKYNNNIRRKVAKRKAWKLAKKGACACGGLSRYQHLIGKECFRPNGNACRRRAHRRNT